MYFKTCTLLNPTFPHLVLFIRECLCSKQQPFKLISILTSARESKSKRNNKTVCETNSKTVNGYSGALLPHSKKVGNPICDPE